jgi:ribosomal protein S18 acetylase RimI-like enzyme
VATSDLIVRQHPPSAKNLEGREAFVLNVYTLPRFRGRGIAPSLLQKTIAAARDAQSADRNQKSKVPFVAAAIASIRRRFNAPRSPSGRFLICRGA